MTARLRAIGKVMLLVCAAALSETSAVNLTQTPTPEPLEFYVYVSTKTYLPYVPAFAYGNPKNPTGDMLLSLNASSTVFWYNFCNQDIFSSEELFTCSSTPTLLSDYFTTSMEMAGSPLTSYATPASGIDGFVYSG